MNKNYLIKTTFLLINLFYALKANTLSENILIKNYLSEDFYITNLSIKQKKFIGKEELLKLKSKLLYKYKWELNRIDRQINIRKDYLKLIRIFPSKKNDSINLINNDIVMDKKIKSNFENKMNYMITFK